MYRIMAVEDDPIMQSVLRDTIRPEFEFVLSPNGREALESASREKPDLILLDMMLPGKTGLDYLTELRKDARFADTPVVVISVRADTAYRTRARELGVVRYLLKPFSPAVLRHEIQQILGVSWQDSGKLSGLPPSNV